MSGINRPPITRTTVELELTICLVLLSRMTNIIKKSLMSKTATTVAALEIHI